MKLVSRELLSRIYVLIILLCLGYLGMQAYRHSPWHKQHLLNDLVQGDAQQQLHAACALAQIGAQDELLAALRTEQSNAREMAQRGLEFLWFNAAGQKAYALLQAAHRAAETNQYEDALALLNTLTAQFPRFAEGWNRRAAVHWQLNHYAQSLADCERALQLNPHHYGAWQGIGLCKIEMGDVAGACQSLRAALKIIPHDAATRDSLRRCEELLKRVPNSEKSKLLERGVTLSSLPSRRALRPTCTRPALPSHLRAVPSTAFKMPPRIREKLRRDCPLPFYRECLRTYLASVSGPSLSVSEAMV